MPNKSYQIYIKADHILVEFEADFDYHMLRDVMRIESQMPEAQYMNDIWLIGKHHALISLTDLESILADVRAMSPEGVTSLKSALVIEPGLTEAIAHIWLQEAKGRTPFTCRIFHTLDEAEEWIH